MDGEVTPEQELDMLAEGQLPTVNEDKFTGFAVGLPDDLSLLPTTRYQALNGRVYTLTRWPDGSTARGEVPLKELEDLSGAQVREGWYDALGAYLGASIPMEEPPPEPEL